MTGRRPTWLSTTTNLAALLPALAEQRAGRGRGKSRAGGGLLEKGRRKKATSKQFDVAHEHRWMLFPNEGAGGRGSVNALSQLSRQSQRRGKKSERSRAELADEAVRRTFTERSRT